MNVLFKELPPFERARSDYLDDDGFRGLQNLLIKDPQFAPLLKGRAGCGSSVILIRGVIRARAEAFASFITGGCKVNSSGFLLSLTRMKPLI